MPTRRKILGNFSLKKVATLESVAVVRGVSAKCLAVVRALMQGAGDDRLLC